MQSTAHQGSSGGSKRARLPLLHHRRDCTPPCAPPRGLPVPLPPLAARAMLVGGILLNDLRPQVRESVKEFFPGFPAKATYIPSPPTYPADYTNFSFVDPLTKHTYGPYAKASLPPPPPNPHNRRTPHSRLQHDPQFYAGFNPLCLQALVMGEWFETADGATVTPREYLKNGVYVVDLMGAAYCYNGTFAGLRVSDGSLA